MDAAIAYVAASPCALAIVPIEDLLGLSEAPNLPGTVDEHPNWRRRLDAPVARSWQPPVPQRDWRVCAVGRQGRARRPGILRMAGRRRGWRMIPRATYRLQFNADFTFVDAQAIVPYLADLGISHVYASPVTAAPPV